MCFVLAAVTDALDGAGRAMVRYPHRAWAQSSIRFADKLMLLSALVVLTFEHALPVWLFDF